MIKIFDIKLKQVDDILISGTSRGNLLLSLPGGGTFEGERIKGKVLPLGLCTTYTPESGLNFIHSPQVLVTDDGATIFMELNAYLHLSQDLEDRISAGEVIDPSTYYYKGTVRFDVGDPSYKWLENKLFVCDGIIDNWKQLQFAVYEI
ncbi:MAG: DUF3237 family protein [Anaerovoracaceae bacterium]|jgi:hypothetical protein